MAAKESDRIYELDLLRFLAAIAVLMYHYTFAGTRLFHTPSFSIDLISRYGYLGVDAFFIISGYVLPFSAMGKPAKTFIISRIARLYPAYWVCCILTFIFFQLKNLQVQNAGTLPGFKLLAYNLSMLQEFFGKQHLNGVFWTLSYELIFYFLILLISVFKLWKHLLSIISLWLIYTIITDVNASGNAFAILLIPKYSCCFIAGLLFYLLRTKQWDAWKVYLLLAVCFFSNLKKDVGIMNNMNTFYNDAHAYRVEIVIFIVTLFYLIFWMSATKRLNFYWLKHTSGLGNMTYSLYLFHGFGVGVFIFFGNKMNKYLLLTLLTFVMIYVSFLTYKYIELSLQRKLKRIVTDLFTFIDDTSGTRRLLPGRFTFDRLFRFGTKGDQNTFDQI